MRLTHFLFICFIFLQAVAHASELVLEVLEKEVQALEAAQDPNGAFYPINCLNKEMTRTCYGDKSLFFTALMAESLVEFPLERTEAIRHKTIQYLAQQFKEQDGTIRYYETTGKLYPIVKPDVDDNGIVLSLLMGRPELADQELISKKVHELYNNSIITHTFKRKSNKKETFEGKYLSTWVNPTDPFFNDIDLVVNFNGLLAFAKYNLKAKESDRLDFKPVCSTVNQLISWSADNEFHDLVSIRHWTRRRKENYSQWYPSKYAVMLSLVRAHLAGGKESCLLDSYQRVRQHLLSKKEFEGNVYDKALATAALARILHHEQLNKSPLENHILKIHEMLRDNKLGHHPFFFYGAVGYTGSVPMVRVLLHEIIAIFMDQHRTPASKTIAELDFLNTIITEQMNDGSFTALIKPSSPLYNIFVIYMYEYLGLTESKKEIVQALIEHVFTQQKDNGALVGYPQGPDHLGISSAGYVAAKIAGINEDDPRMLKLESKIKEMGGPLKSDMLTVPFLMMFSLHHIHTTHNSGIDRLVMKMSEKLPWVKVLIHPVLYLVDNGHNKILSEDKYPKRIFKQTYDKYLLKRKIPKLPEDNLFQKWAMANINPDGTFFDYTPTTVPMLMALSTFPEFADVVKKGVHTIESFQELTPEGHLLQTPGEASIGETFYVANSLLDVGFDHANPTVKRAEKYLLDHQLKSGGWGFSKNSLHFADSDDTSNAMYFLIRLDQARGKKIRPEVFKALEWLLAVQNKDGGFGTWEKTQGGVIGNLINRVANKRGLVMSESVFEHTARIVVCLSFLRKIRPEADEAYQKAFKWLLRQQKWDGSFAGTWFINYIFSTSMALTALSTDHVKADKAILKGLKYLKKMQGKDGGYGESPDSFLQGKAVQLSQSSWAQTGLTVSQLHTMNALSQCKYHHEMHELLETTHLYLRDEKDGWTKEMDPTWTAVTFPKVEYLIYPYIQRMVPWQAYNMQLSSNCK